MESVGPSHTSDKKKVLYKKTFQEAGKTASANKITIADSIQLTPSLFMLHYEKISKNCNIFRGWQVHDKFGKVPIAIKSIEYNTKNEQKVRNILELQSHSNVNNIIQTGTFYSGPFKQIFIAMEYRGFQTLTHSFKDPEKPNSRQLKLNLVKQLIDGVAHLHTNYIVHGYLHPDNILVSDDGQHIKIICLGKYSQTFFFTSKMGVMQDEDIWSAPEIQNSDRYIITKQTDLFSLALVIYYILTDGSHPFVDSDDVRKKNMKLYKHLDLAQLESDMKDLLYWMLRFNPHERPSMEQIRGHKCFGGEVVCPFPEQSSIVGTASTKGIISRNMYGDTLGKLNRLKINVEIDNLQKDRTNVTHVTTSLFMLHKEKFSKCGDVYRGWQIHDNFAKTKIALKTLEYNKKSKKEVRTMLHLTPHPNIIDIIQCGIFYSGTLKRIFIAMQIFGSQNLKDFIMRSKTSKSEPLKQTLVKQVIDAISHIHRNNIIHGDLQPDNILVSDQFQVKVIDFGSCLEINSGESTTALNVGRIGTDGWRAPEAYNAGTISKKADIFSLALVIHVILTDGFHPFGMDSDEWNINIKQYKGLNLSILDNNMIDLLSWLLRLKPQERPNAEQIQQHISFGGKMVCPFPKVGDIQSNIIEERILELQHKHIWDNEDEMNQVQPVKQELRLIDSVESEVDLNDYLTISSAEMSNGTPLFMPSWCMQVGDAKTEKVTIHVLQQKEKTLKWEITERLYFSNNPKLKIQSKIVPGQTKVGIPLSPINHDIFKVKCHWFIFAHLIEQKYNLGFSLADSLWQDSVNTKMVSENFKILLSFNTFVAKLNDNIKFYITCPTHGRSKKISTFCIDQLLTKQISPMFPILLPCHKECKQTEWNCQLVKSSLGSDADTELGVDDDILVNIPTNSVFETVSKAWRNVIYEKKPSTHHIDELCSAITYSLQRTGRIQEVYNEKCGYGQNENELLAASGKIYEDIIHVEWQPDDTNFHRYSVEIYHNNMREKYFETKARSLRHKLLDFNKIFKEYIFKISGIYCSGCSSDAALLMFSQSDSVKNDTMKVVAKSANNSILVTWPNTQMVKFYRVQVYGDDYPEDIFSTTSRVFQFMDVQPSKLYYFKVQAFQTTSIKNEVIKCGLSNCVLLNTDSDNFQEVKVSVIEGDFFLSWNPQENLDQDYVVSVFYTDMLFHEIQTSSPAARYTPHQPSVEYFFKVQSGDFEAFSQNVTSAPGNVVSFIKENKIHLTWDDVKNASLSVQIRVLHHGQESGTYIGKDGKFTLSTFQPASTYSFQVWTRDKFGIDSAVVTTNEVITPNQAANLGRGEAGIKSLPETYLGQNIHVYLNTPLREGYNVYEGYVDFGSSRKKVAVKVLGIRSRQHAYRELIHAMELRHRNIVEYIRSSSSTMSTEMYIAMELCMVETLHEKVLNKTLKDLNIEYKDVLYQISSGIEYMHKMGTLHRDLKPQNILISLDGKTIKLSDFGLTKKISHKTQATKSSHYIGTQGWAAPEQFNAERKTLSTKSDIYSAGLIFYFVLSEGEHPYGKDMRKCQMAMVEGAEYDMSHLKGPEVILAQDIISKMIVYNLDNRPNAEEVLDHPFFWTVSKKLSFVFNVGNCLGRRNLNNILNAKWIKNHSDCCKWNVNDAILKRILPPSYSTRYKSHKVTDLVRFIRNTYLHNRNNIFKSMPHLYSYSEEHFPHLFIFLYNEFKVFVRGPIDPMIPYCFKKFFDLS
uniref:uncharacterized protein LOC120326396 n=1 Tax=Styela clava TaxID=7725 RepID=UPI00193A542C|nr:uncharacterized protein LOC120326396 [Styela clava]